MTETSFIKNLARIAWLEWLQHHDRNAVERHFQYIEYLISKQEQLVSKEEQENRR